MKKWHLWLAASIGLVVIAGMMIREFDVDALSSIDLSPGFFLGVGIAVGLFALQNLMLSLRFQHLCHRRLSLMQSFRVNVLCEFTSAVTPSAVGGSGLAFVYLNREGVTMGRSIFTMFAALLADEAFLAVSCCLLYFLVPSHLLFSMVDGVGVSADVVNEWIKGGVQVVGIKADGILARARVKQGFVITHINDRPVYSLGDMQRMTEKVRSIDGVYPNGRSASYTLVE